MKKLRIYVDTSVIGGCLDTEFKNESCMLLEMAYQDKAILLISDLLLAELFKAPNEVRSVLSSLPEKCIESISTNAETRQIRDYYLEEKIVGKRSSSDAHHVATATVYQADMIVSWNFKHIVHYEKIRHFNAVNLREGYGTIEIYSPKEVV